MTLHILWGGVNGVFWEDVAVDNMIVSRITPTNNILVIISSLLLVVEQMPIFFLTYSKVNWTELQPLP